MYPADAQSDFLQSVEEGSSLKELLLMVFSETPEWDVKRRYSNVSKLCVFWNHPGERDRLVRIKQSRCLADLIGKLVTRIERGILPFYICPDGADSEALINRFRGLDSF